MSSILTLLLARNIIDHFNSMTSIHVLKWPLVNQKVWYKDKNLLWKKLLTISTLRGNILWLFPLTQFVPSVKSGRWNGKIHFKFTYTPFTNAIMRILISALFGRKIGTGAGLSAQNNRHNIHIGSRLQNLWTQFQNNVDYFQGAVKGHLISYTLIRIVFMPFWLSTEDIKYLVCGFLYHSSIYISYVQMVT